MGSSASFQAQNHIATIAITTITRTSTFTDIRHDFVLLLSLDKLLGTPLCPRLTDIPMLEPLVCKKISHERLTALVFRDDCFITACQEGFVQTWARPGHGANAQMLCNPSAISDDESDHVDDVMDDDATIV